MKVLVIGASGFLGKTVYHLLKEAGDDVIGTYNSKPVEGMQQLDVLDVDGLLSLLEDFQPDDRFELVEEPLETEQKENN